MRTIAIINQKGGCGKTTSAINLAAVFARRGFRTLLVDLDPQSHCAAGLGVPEEQIERDVADALLAPADARLDREQLLWRVTRGLDLLPSRMRLAGLEASRGGLAEAPDKDHRLASVIGRLSRASGDPAPEGEEPDRVFDICLIDCPPSIGLLTYNALVAARELIVPVETSYFALKGAEKQVKTMRSIGRRLGVRNRARLLPTLHDASVPVSRDLLDEMRSKFGQLLIPTIIRADAALREAASVGRPVIDHAPDSTGAEDYTSLCEWLEEHARIDRGELIEDEALPLRVERPTPRVQVMPGASDSVLGRREPARPSGPVSRLDELTARVREMKQGGSAASMTPEQRLAALRTVASVNGAPPAPPTADASRTTGTPESRGASGVLTLIEKEPEQVRPMDSGARALLGSRPTARGVLFVLPLALGERVFVAGDFNGWQAGRHELRRNPERGVFELEIPLPPGEYQYRLVIDGRWGVDPYASRCTLNSQGEPNSVVCVPARAGA